MRKLICAAGIVLLISSCNNNTEKSGEPVPGTDSLMVDTPAVTRQVFNKDSLLNATGRDILSILKSKKYDSLVKYFSSSDSVHFSPYGFIGSGEQTLSAKDFTTVLSGNKKLNWGSYDGSGDSINLTAKQYIEKFVYNADFLNAEKIAVDSFVKTGNSLNNLKKSYPGSRFIEYHFSGFDKKYAGMDWTSLRLVFKEFNDRYYLIAIVHDQWTV